MRGRTDADTAEQLQRRLIDMLAGDGAPDDASVHAAIHKLLSEDRTLPPLTVSGRKALAQQLFKSVRRLDILQELLDDPTVTEIMVNGPDRIFFERGGRLQRWDRTFSSPEKLEDVIRQIAKLLMEPKGGYVRTCKSCGKELPAANPFGLCEDCFRKMKKQRDL